MQPALTNYIKRLEQELDVPLIVHGVSPVQFTEYGEIFLKYAKEIVVSDDKMHECLMAAKERNPDLVRLAVTAAGMTNFVAYVNLIREKFPQLEIKFLEGDSASCEERLLERTADLALFTAPVLSKDIKYERLLKNPMILVLSNQHPIVKNRNLEGNSPEKPFMLSVRELQNQTFITTGPRSGNARFNRQFGEEQKITPKEVLQFESLNTGFYMAASGGGIMILPYSSVKRMQANEFHPVYCSVRGVELGRDFIIACNSKVTLSSPAAMLWNEITKNHFE